MKIVPIARSRASGLFTVEHGSRDSLLQLILDGLVVPITSWVLAASRCIERLTQETVPVVRNDRVPVVGAHFVTGRLALNSNFRPNCPQKFHFLASGWR